MKKERNKRQESREFKKPGRLWVSDLTTSESIRSKRSEWRWHVNAVLVGGSEIFTDGKSLLLLCDDTRSGQKT